MIQRELTAPSGFVAADLATPDHAAQGIQFDPEIFRHFVFSETWG